MANVPAPTRSADVMLNMIKADPVKLDAILKSNDPITKLQEIGDEAKEEATKQTLESQAIYLQDKNIYRIAVYVLGALAIIAALGGTGLAIFKLSLPESVVALGSAAVGALVGLFADKPTGN